MTFWSRADDESYVNTHFSLNQFRDKDSLSRAARINGFRVHDWRVTTKVIADGNIYEASLYVDDYDAVVDILSWTCNGDTVQINQLPPAAYSEGVRMATLACEHARPLGR